MNTKTCANSKCDTEFTSARPDKKYCSSTCKKREGVRKWREANPEKYRERSLKRYYEQTKPRGITLDQRLWDMFQRQALRDPNGLPELAQRVLEWKPKGFAKEKQFVLNHGTTERDWMYYIELTPEEATMQWQDEAA